MNDLLEQEAAGLRGRDIICFSTHFWDERRFRKQEFMERFARANRVLYVEPSFSMIRPPEPDLAGVATNRAFVPRLEQRAENLFLLKPPRGLPKWTSPPIERANYRWFASIVARTARHLGIRDPLLWLYRPSFIQALDAIPHSGLVFDLVDDLVGYEGDDNRRASYVRTSVEMLARRSDLLVVTAKTLEEAYGDIARRTVHIPNGFDAELFDGMPRSLPDVLVTAPRPIIGFVGTLFGFLDFELLEQVAKAHPDKTLLLVGPTESSVEGAVRTLTMLPNVISVGARPRDEIPAFAAACDICLNPFRRGAVSDNVNPLKVYEYLAMGRPVISTPMRALQMETIAPSIIFAEGDEFIRQIDVALSDSVEEDPTSRRALVEEYSWDALFARLDAVCGSVFSEARSSKSSRA